jgi:hypothetical protein
VTVPVPLIPFTVARTLTEPAATPVTEPDADTVAAVPEFIAHVGDAATTTPFASRAVANADVD